jgi:hypothetical protein
LLSFLRKVLDSKNVIRFSFPFFQKKKSRQKKFEKKFLAVQKMFQDFLFPFLKKNKDGKNLVKIFYSFFQKKKSKTYEVKI